MIKTLLNADEELPPGIEIVVEETVVNLPTETQNAKNLEIRPVFEIPEDAKFFTKTPETTDEPAQVAETFSIAEPFVETPNDEFINLETPQIETENPIIAAQSEDEKANSETSEKLFQSEVKPQSAGETIRQSGMAWSAAIILFGSVVFMMILGWFADLLLGSSPWGIVGGIILGGIIGFIQFFRITSQIFKK